MLCNNSGFDGSDHEECRFLGCKSPIPTSQKTHYVSATEPNGIMLSGETVALYCENHTEQKHTNTVRTSQEILRFQYIAQLINAVWRNSRCLL
jgi:hypothetical protein